MASYDTIDYKALFRSVNRDQPAPEAEKSRGFMRGAADLGLEAASGLTRGVGMLANVFGANNAVSQGARSADELIREYLSAQSKEDSARASAILAEAEDAGIADQVIAGVRAFAQNPVSTVVNTLGQAVPTIATALIPGVGTATLGGRVAMAGMGAAQGAGSVKGSIFEGVKSEQMRQPGTTEADATVAAERAQAWGGENTGNIVGGAALGGVAGSTGFQPAAARMLAGRGMLSKATEDVEQSLLRRMGANRLADVAETRAGAAATGALVEGGTEFAQGGQEQYATNVALQREGFDVPTFRGVVSQGTMEAVAGGALGAGFGAMEKPRKASIKDIADAPTVDDAIKAFTKVLALPAPATKAEWEVVDGQQLLEGPSQPPAPPATPLLPGPTEPPALMVDQFGNVTQQPAAQRAEAVSRANMAAAGAERVAAEANQRTQELGKQTARGESPPERIPVGEATRMEMIPTGDATDWEYVPTGDATELTPEVIEPQDLTTTDGMPYGTKSGANMRARKEGLGPANVLQVAGGWIIRPQPTALGQPGQEVQPNNTRSTSAADVLKAPNVPVADLARTPTGPAGAGDGSSPASLGSIGTVRSVPDVPGRPVRAAAAPEPSSGTPAAVGGVGRPDASLTPAIPAEGTQLVMDGRPYTVAAAGKRYVTIVGQDGKERVISDGSHLWPRVRAALKAAEPVQQPPETQTDAPAPVQKAAESEQVQADRASDEASGVAEFSSGTFDSWKRQGMARGSAKGWTIFHDQVANEFVLARKVTERNEAGGGYVVGQVAAQRFKTIDEAKRWASSFGATNQPQVAPVSDLQAPAGPVDWKARMEAAMKADGAAMSPAQRDKAAQLRQQGDKLQDEARQMLAGIPAGQPVRSSRDANLREKAREKSRKAIELQRQADEIEKQLDAPASDQQVNGGGYLPGQAAAGKAGRQLNEAIEQGRAWVVEVSGQPIYRAATERAARGMAAGNKNAKVYQEQPAKAQTGGTPVDGAATARPTPGMEAPATLKDRLSAVSKAKKANTVYKTRRAAEEARTGNTQRLRKTADGYILRDATDKELAAAEKSGRRLAGSGVDVEKDSLLAAIAKLGGLSITERSDTIGEGNRNIGGKMLFTRTGKALDTLADEALREFGYVPLNEVNRDGGVRWLRDAIKSEFNQGTQHFSEQGLDEIMRREHAQQEAEFMASREAEDVFGDLDADEVQATGYTSASPEVQAATEQAVAEAMAQGVDVESVRERVSMQTEGLTQDEYETAVQQALAEAVAQTRTDDGRADASAARAGNKDRGQAADRQGQEEGLTLETQDATALRAKTEREAKAKADEAKTKTAEQERLRREAEARDINDRARQDASAENFVLGQDAGDALAGQGGLFDAPAASSTQAEDAPPSAPTRNEPLIALRKRISVLESLRTCLG